MNEILLVSEETKEKIATGRNETHKFCPRCLQVKPVGEFHRNNIRYDGLAVYCKKYRQESHLRTTEKQYYGLHKRPYPLNGKCELCGAELGKSYYHHFDDNNPSWGVWVCCVCDFLGEGIDEIEKNPWKVNLYRILKKEIEETEETYVYLGPYVPPDGVYRLFLNGEQTHKWCPHCGEMKLIDEFSNHHNSYDGLRSWCKECKRAFCLRSQGERFHGLHKRPKPGCCELCGSKTKLDYHHWDDANKSKGVWVCLSDKCHNLVEAVDRLDNGSLLPKKYHELKQGIILEEVCNNHIANLESCITILEAGNILSETIKII